VKPTTGATPWAARSSSRSKREMEAMAVADIAAATRSPEPYVWSVLMNINLGGLR
jgi:hypothetical protein